MTEEDESFRAFARVCRLLESTPSRSEKVRIVAQYLRSLTPEAAGTAAMLLIGMTVKEGEKDVAAIGWSAVSSALKAVGNSTLIEHRPLTVAEVWSALNELKKYTGLGSRIRKVRALAALLRRCDDLEKSWLLRVLSGEMRHGVSHGLLLEAASKLTSMMLEEVTVADMLLGDVGELVRRALTGTLKEVRLEVMKPVRPMLAEMAYDPSEILSAHGGRTLVEPKYDGVRVQVHCRSCEVRVFTRRLKDVTSSLPEVCDAVRRSVSWSEFIIDGEVVAVDKEGNPLPFQETMRRVGREREIEELASSIPLRFWAFDVMLINGSPKIALPLSERRKALESAVDHELLTPAKLCTTRSEIEDVLSLAMRMGHEGVIAKDPDSRYLPGRRGAKWLKLKPPETLDVVIVAAEWGHGRRSGWLSNYHLAVRDVDGKGYAVVGKTFKGLRDDEFEWMTRRLMGLKTVERPWGIEVKPEVVVEVAFNEVQRSPKYESGYALRFARVTRIREDKGPEDVSTLSEVAAIYRRQSLRKGRSDSARLPPW
ncbi:MAG: ATP-dependent DNA ligase [Thaumarchaeota archaeon]|nr:ATP-dependent DNA ligase [Candidatus Calditenuaceae archaeon]MDW8186553.1 ATP-dependent DNA ligase [Nitrososphaerota archaeon]